MKSISELSFQSNLVKTLNITFPYFLPVQHPLDNFKHGYNIPTRLDLPGHNCYAS